MGGVLGVVEVIGADTAFLAEVTRPAVPGAERSFVETSPRSRVATPDGKEKVLLLIDSSLSMSLDAARSQADSVRSSTTLAALAQYLEALEREDEAIAAAEDALQLCVVDRFNHLADPMAARIALETLMRLGRLDQAIAHARRLPLSPHASLALGATMASCGRFLEAHKFVDGVQAPEKDAVLGFLLLAEGKDSHAVARLRFALRERPDDSDTAHNLSIALWRLGSRRKAIASALQATRTSPGREDISLHYLELLLAEREFGRVDGEVNALLATNVAPTAGLLVIHARARLGLGDLPQAVRLLERAAQHAQSEGNPSAAVDIRSNLIRLRAWQGDLAREAAFDQLAELHHLHPSNEAVVANLAQAAFRRHHAAPLRDAYRAVREGVSDAGRAFIEYQIATLEGDNATAASKAVEWLKREPQSREATFAAIVALGTGQARWSEAADIALGAMRMPGSSRVELNNAAYVLAMAGMPDRAIKLLEPLENRDYVLNATLGLARLASGQLDLGMKLYRDAACEAEKQGNDARSLIALYQALVVRQLGLSEVVDQGKLSAMSLPSVDLPEDWEDRPEFLRLFGIAIEKGYSWPLEL